MKAHQQNGDRPTPDPKPGEHREPHEPRPEESPQPRDPDPPQPPPMMPDLPSPDANPIDPRIF